MPKFSKKSAQRLASCDAKLQRLFEKVVEHYDCVILCGHRTEIEQEDAVKSGASKLHWPHSGHNKLPSLAVDAVPYPVDWEEWKDNPAPVYHFAGYVMGIAESMGIGLLWGGDFNNNLTLTDDRFVDGPHFELRKQQ